MRFLLVILFLFAAFPAYAAELEQRSVVQGSMTRDYFLYDPRAGGEGEKRPLILVLHGGGGKAEKFDVMTGKKNSFNALAAREDILIAYPQGYNKSWNDGREAGQVDAQAKEIDDSAFLEGIIDTLVRERNVDPKRVYAVGPSNGGHMSNRLACDLSGKIAAVGIVIGLMPKKYEDKCKPSAPVSVLIMNGTEDPLVPYNGGMVKVMRQERGEDISTAATFAFWLKHAGFTGDVDALKAEQLPDTDPDDKTHISLQSFKGKQSQVALYTVTGGGHTWPGGRQYLPQMLVGRTSQDMNATEVIWDFFKANGKP